MRSWNVIVAQTRKHMLNTVTDRKSGSFNYIDKEKFQVGNEKKDKKNLNLYSDLQESRPKEETTI